MTEPTERKIPEGIVAPDSNFDYNSIVEETVLHAGNWKIPLRNLQAWSFIESASGYVINYVVTGIGVLENTTYAKTEEELEDYLTKLYGKSVAKYLMEGHAQNG
jgi:hypothetical protein